VSASALQFLADITVPTDGVGGYFANWQAYAIAIAPLLLVVWFLRKLWRVLGAHPVLLVVVVLVGLATIGLIRFTGAGLGH